MEIYTRFSFKKVYVCCNTLFFDYLFNLFSRLTDLNYLLVLLVRTVEIMIGKAEIQESLSYNYHLSVLLKGAKMPLSKALVSAMCRFERLNAIYTLKCC